MKKLALTRPRLRQTHPLSAYLSRCVISLSRPFESSGTCLRRAGEIQKLVDIADIRGNVILSMLGTWRLPSRNALEARIQTCETRLGEKHHSAHVHLEADIVKGHYGVHDTFIPAEGVDWLNLYLDARRNGSNHKLSQSRLLEGRHRIPRNHH